MADDIEQPDSSDPGSEGGPVKSFLDHLEDLRWVLIKSVSTLAVAMLLCLIAGDYVVGIRKWPLERAKVSYPGTNQVEGTAHISCTTGSLYLHARINAERIDFIPGQFLASHGKIAAAHCHAEIREWFANSDFFSTDLFYYIRQLSVEGHFSRRRAGSNIDILLEVVKNRQPQVRGLKIPVAFKIIALHRAARIEPAEKIAATDRRTFIAHECLYFFSPMVQSEAEVLNGRCLLEIAIIFDVQAEPATVALDVVAPVFLEKVAYLLHQFAIGAV